MGPSSYWHGPGRSWKQEALEQFRLHGLALDWLEAIEADPDTYPRGRSSPAPPLSSGCWKAITGLEIGWLDLDGACGLRAQSRTCWIALRRSWTSSSPGTWCCPQSPPISACKPCRPRMTPGAGNWPPWIASDPFPMKRGRRPLYGRPFLGLHKRLDALGNHHADRLRVLEAASQEARSAADILGDLFDRPLDGHQIIFAMGEAIAHLNHLEHQGRLRSRLGPDGILRFQAMRQDSPRQVKTPIHS